MENDVVNLLTLRATSNSFSTKNLRQLVDNFTRLVEIVFPKNILDKIQVKVSEGSQVIDVVVNKMESINFETPYQCINTLLFEKNTLPEKDNIKAAKYIKSLCDIDSEVTISSNVKVFKEIALDKALAQSIDKKYLASTVDIQEMGILEGIIHSISDNKVEKYNQIKIEERISNRLIPCTFKDGYWVEEIFQKNLWQKLVVITGIIHYSKTGECKKIEATKIEDYKESFAV
jgi:hypothetical protein